METIFLIAVLILGLGVFFWLERRRRHLTAGDRKEFFKKWREIEERAERDIEKAVLEGDKLIDLILKRKEIGGRTMNERLKRASRLFSNFRGVKKAHFLRNKIVHEADFKLSEKEGKEALRSIEKGLRDLWR